MSTKEDLEFFEFEHDTADIRLQNEDESVIDMYWVRNNRVINIEIRDEETHVFEMTLDDMHYQIDMEISEDDVAVIESSHLGKVLLMQWEIPNENEEEEEEEE